MTRTTLGMIIILFNITACNSNVQPSPDSQTKLSDNNNQSNDADRGFDPCLINANLPVCTQDKKAK